MNKTLVDVKKKINENCDITVDYINRVNNNEGIDSVPLPRIEPFTSTMAHLQETVMLYNRI